MALSDLPPPQKVVRKWHSLGEEKGEGRIRRPAVVLADADRDFEAFREIDDSGQAPNELCVGVFAREKSRGQGQGTREGLEDPYVKLKVAARRSNRAQINQ